MRGIDKETVVYIYATEYYLAIKEQNIAICSNIMDGFRDNHTRRDKDK